MRSNPQERPLTNGVRRYCLLETDLGHWAPFWSAFIRAARNAGDHGVGPNHMRNKAGKPVHGTISMRTFPQEERFVVEISDDGMRLDWGEVAREATDFGLPSATPAALLEAVFHDGWSAAAHETELFGRGVGIGTPRPAS